MKQILIAFSVLLAPALCLAQEQQIEISSNLEIVVAPSPGAPGLADMLAHYDRDANRWDNSRRYVRGVKFYQSHLMIPPDALVENNTYYNLRREGVFWVTHNRLRLDTRIEVAALKNHNCQDTLDGIEYAVSRAVNAVVNMIIAGGRVKSLDIDTSLGVCGYTEKQAAFAVARWFLRTLEGIDSKLAQMRLADPNVPHVRPRLSEIEPYPFRSIKQHKEYIAQLHSELNKRGLLPLETYFLDIDHRLVSDGVLVRDVNEFAGFCKLMGIRSGIIVNGEDVKPGAGIPDLVHLISANERLARFKRLGLFGLVDTVVFQSWARGPDGRQNIPLNVPEDNHTLTNFLWHGIKCIAGVVDCSEYPELERGR